MIDAVLDAFEEDVFPPEIERFRSSYSATAPRLTGELASGLDKTETDRDDRRKTVTTRTGSQVEHAAFVEYGTERTAAQPFGRSAWRRTRRSTDRAVDKQVTKRIRDR